MMISLVWNVCDSTKEDAVIIVEKYTKDVERRIGYKSKAYMVK